MNKKEIIGRVRKALDKLLRMDTQLIDLDVNERSISHKLAEYLQKEFNEYNVDCEYNRHLNLIKRIKIPSGDVYGDDTEAKTIFPDIIIHKRNSDENNLLVIEIKKSNNSINREFDKTKLKLLTKANGDYRYTLGLFIEFNMNKKHPDFKCFEDGEEITDTN